MMLVVCWPCWPAGSTLPFAGRTHAPARRFSLCADDGQHVLDRANCLIEALASPLLLPPLPYLWLQTKEGQSRPREQLEGKITNRTRAHPKARAKTVHVWLARKQIMPVFTKPFCLACSA